MRPESYSYCTSCYGCKYKSSYHVKPLICAIPFCGYDAPDHITEGYARDNSVFEARGCDERKEEK